MKELFKEEFKIGGDGGVGSAAATAEGGLIKVKIEAGFPIRKILSPIAQKVKDLIPGEKYDGFVDTALNAVLKYFGVDDEAPAAPHASAPAQELE